MPAVSTPGRKKKGQTGVRPKFLRLGESSHNRIHSKNRYSGLSTELSLRGRLPLVIDLSHVLLFQFPQNCCHFLNDYGQQAAANGPAFDSSQVEPGRHRLRLSKSPAKEGMD
jgi:hypothetical protein